MVSGRSGCFLKSDETSKESQSNLAIEILSVTKGSEPELCTLSGQDRTLPTNVCSVGLMTLFSHPETFELRKPSSSKS